jgi:hypothetical protein
MPLQVEIRSGQSVRNPGISLGQRGNQVQNRKAAISDLQRGSL